MQAIGHTVTETSPAARIVYVSSERYMNELITSIQRGRTLEFKDKYRGVDLLLIDDIQFFETKERTQEEFFHTFNALYEARRQIVVTSDRPPHDITMLEERLVSRFQCGLVADIQPPDIETRVAILHAKAESEGEPLPDDVALFIANSAKSNIRELEGAFTRLLALATLQRIPLGQLTVEYAAEALSSLLRPSRRRVSVDEIQLQVAHRYGLSIEQLRGKRRTSTIAEGRQVAMYLCRQLTDLSLSDIGAKFGKRDHTTVLYACSKVRQQIASNADLRRFIESTLNQLGDGSAG
jgi:chromosomal replication initiator protein